MSPRAYPGKGALASALFDLLAQLLDDLGHGLLHPRELPVLDLDQPRRGGRRDRRRARLLFEQALLAEVVAGAEVGNLLALALDLHGAVIDHVEVVGVAALADDGLALRDRFEAGEGRDLRELVVVHISEQRRVLQRAYVHGSPPLGIFAGRT